MQSVTFHGLLSERTQKARKNIIGRMGDIKLKFDNGTVIAVYFPECD